MMSHEVTEAVKQQGRTFCIALCGNPNSGKTSLFNELTGSHQHVGNWPGVTVEKKEGRVTFNDWEIRVVDLPGTYSLTAFSPEEIAARDFIVNEKPDVVINVVDSTNLERNLYLTTQLIELEVKGLVALNMVDEADRRGISTNLRVMAELLGMPVVPTVATRGRGMESLLQCAMDVHNHENLLARKVHIPYSNDVEEEILRLGAIIDQDPGLAGYFPPRWLAVKLLERDEQVIETMRSLSARAPEIERQAEAGIRKLEEIMGDEPETLIADGRYGFIGGVLIEAFSDTRPDRVRKSEMIDRVLTHRVLGFPFFFAILWLMFYSTFALGQYPMQGLEWLVDHLSGYLSLHLPQALWSDLLIHGILAGVGSVVVFLPVILILFLFISLLEDSGYMARAAFIMDRIMHLAGLHGKSFIPLVMGFGCNAPAIIATRTLENKSDRMITILINPLMSCSARLPIYTVIAGACFGSKAGHVIFSLYLLGICIALLVGRVFRRTLFKAESAPFVLELPPYRIPTLKSVVLHMWHKASCFLRKVGGVILVASIIIWGLSTFPRDLHLSQDYSALAAGVEAASGRTIAAIQEHSISLPPGHPHIPAEVRRLSEAKEERETRLQALESARKKESVEKSYLGQLGRAIEPCIRPLGFGWKEGVALISGFSAKEIIVSTLGILYGAGAEEKLPHALSQEMTPLSAYSFLVFTLVYLPCLGTLMVMYRELGSLKWALFAVVYTFVLAWALSFVIYQGGKLIGWG
jgi:ferrous iron transport protein B